MVYYGGSRRYIITAVDYTLLQWSVDDILFQRYIIHYCSGVVKNILSQIHYFSRQMTMSLEESVDGIIIPEVVSGGYIIAAVSLRYIIAVMVGRGYIITAVGRGDIIATAEDIIISVVSG